jgi:glycine cleavage system H protein
VWISAKWWSNCALSAQQAANFMGHPVAQLNFEDSEMSNIPAELRYATSHEWARLEADGTVTVGISDHAQEALGDVVYVELPEVGANLNAGQEAGVVESVKAASDIYAPISGTVLAVNEALSDSPEQVNSDPYASWFFKLQPADAAELDKLLDAGGYAAACNAEA